MSQAETIRFRIKVIEAILDKLLEGHPLFADWQELSKRLYKRARDRNLVVHSEWGWSDEYPEQLLRQDKRRRMEGWSGADFQNAFNRIEDLNRDLHEFMSNVLTEIHEKRITAFITPDMIMEA